VMRNINLALVAGVLTFAWVGTVGAIEVTELAGAAHGYPAFRNLEGKTLGDGEFMQWVEEERLHIRIIYRFVDGGRIEENAVLRQAPELQQEEWSWREEREGKIVREYAVNFLTKMATAQKRDKDEVKHWEEKLELKPGQTFAGFGFTLALANLRQRLCAGERIELKAVGFIPKPQLVTVQLSQAGVDRMRMGERVIRGDHFIIHPEIPEVAKLFVKTPDTQIWLTHPAPAGFLRWEGPLVEPSDALVRVDLLSGAESGAAVWVKDD
jgi:hypothetical protein